MLYLIVLLSGFHVAARCQMPVGGSAARFIQKPGLFA